MWVAGFIIALSAANRCRVILLPLSLLLLLVPISITATLPKALSHTVMNLSETMQQAAKFMQLRATKYGAARS